MGTYLAVFLALLLPLNFIHCGVESGRKTGGGRGNGYKVTGPENFENSAPSRPQNYGGPAPMNQQNFGGPPPPEKFRGPAPNQAGNYGGPATGGPEKFRALTPGPSGRNYGGPAPMESQNFVGSTPGGPVNYGSPAPEKFRVPAPGPSGNYGGPAPMESQNFAGPTPGGPVNYGGPVPEKFRVPAPRGTENLSSPAPRGQENYGGGPASGRPEKLRAPTPSSTRNYGGPDSGRSGNLEGPAPSAPVNYDSPASSGPAKQGEPAYGGSMNYQDQTPAYGGAENYGNQGYFAPKSNAVDAVKTFFNNNDGYNYNFGYDIQDRVYNNFQSRFEKGVGGKKGEVSGSYSVLEADGSTRVVDYVADWKNGFRATVKDKNGVIQYGYSSGYNKGEGEQQKDGYGGGDAGNYVAGREGSAGGIEQASLNAPLQQVNLPYGVKNEGLFNGGQQNRPMDGYRNQPQQQQQNQGPSGYEGGKAGAGKKSNIGQGSAKYGVYVRNNVNQGANVNNY